MNALVEDSRIIIETTAATEQKRSVVIGIPAYNEEKTIAKVVLDAMKHADKVVVCDDGSSDMTAEIAERLGAEVIRHEKNFGYGATIRSLFKRARELNPDVFVTLDGDGQHDPEEIPKVAKPILDGAADITVGSRFGSQFSSSNMPAYRKFGVKLITKLTNAGSEGAAVNDAQSGFRAYSGRSLNELELYENGMGLSSQILMDAGAKHLRICEVPASIRYNNGVKTSVHNPVKHGIDVVTCIIRLFVERRPLLMLGVPGVVFLIGSIAFGVWTLDIYRTRHLVETNVALATIAFLILGLFALSTAITLYAISRIAERLNGKK